MMDLPKATNKRLVAKVLKEIAEPMRAMAEQLAPFDPDHQGDGPHLKETVAVSQKLNRTQRRKAKKESPVEVYIGPASPRGVLQEFGTVNHGAQPFMRPAFDAKARGAFNDLGEKLGAAIAKAVARRRRRSG